jgi:hypothetical protein
MACSGGDKPICINCRHWRPDAMLERPVTGFCLRENIGCLANIATRVIETKALHVCQNFLPRRDACESAGPAAGGCFADPALVIAWGTAR